MNSPDDDNSALIIIPAYNEQKRIAKTISSLKAADPMANILVIDDGSTDDTARIVKSLGIRMIRLDKNSGKGNALNAAITANSSRLWLFLDADLADTAGNGLVLLEPIKNGQADMVVGDLPAPARKGGFGLVKKLARWGIKTCAGIEVNEPLSGQRAARDEVIRKVGSFENGYGVEVGMTIDAVRSGFKFIEIPVELSHAETGRDAAGFLHRGRQFGDVLRVLLKRLIFKR